jgi:hypothetical protein
MANTINMDQFLINNVNNSAQAFSEIAGYSTTKYDTYDAYFFLRKELDEVTDQATFRAAQRNGKIRHVKVYNGRWLDYTARKEFNTLAEWVTDAGDTMENVLYGVNRVHKKDYAESYRTKTFVSQAPKYVTLQHLLTYLGYVAPISVEIPEYNTFDRFADILSELEMLNGPVPPQGRNCLVQKPDNTIVIGRVVDQKYYSLEDTESQICVSVPQDTQYEVKAYSRLSEMPPGTQVYFRTGDGSFQSISDLMSDE